MLTQEQLDLIEETDLNACDSCFSLLDSEDLIWLTVEDFQPKAGEVPPIGFDALCVPCYYELS